MKNISKFCFVLFLSLIFFSCSEESDVENQETNFIETSDLTYFNEVSNSNGNLLNRGGWPHNGCRSFDVTLGSDVIFGTVEFSLNHCCVDFVCAEESVWNILDGIFGRTANPEYPNEITITESSSIIIGYYEVWVKTGDYTLDDEGKIENLIYIGEIIE